MVVSRKVCCLRLSLLLVSMAILHTAAAAENTAIRVTLNSGLQTIVTIPRVTLLEITVTNSAVDFTHTTECTRLPNSTSTCTYNVPAQSSLSISFRDSNDNELQLLRITVDDSLQIGCSEYYLQSFVSGETFSFICEPVFVANANGSDNVSIVWRQFLTKENLTRFTTEKTGFEGNIVKNLTDSISVVPSGGVSGARLVIENADNSRIGYYVPSVLFSNMMEEPLQETLLYQTPRVTNADEYDFSVQVTFGTGKANRLDDIECGVDSFPPPNITWRLKQNEDDPGVELTNANTRLEFGNVTQEDTFVAYRTILVINNVQYNDSGIYECVPSNGIVVNGSSVVRLRVKDPLRPLWPALGTIGVFILVGIIIAIGHFVDKCIEKTTENRDRTGGHHRRLFSVTSVTEPETLNSVSTPMKTQAPLTPSHPLVRRLPSSQVKLLEESTAI